MIGPAFAGIDKPGECAAGDRGGEWRESRRFSDRPQWHQLLHRIAEVDLVIALENSEERIAADRGVQKAREFSGVEGSRFPVQRVRRRPCRKRSSLMRWLVGGRESRAGSFVFVVEHFGEEHLGTSDKTARGHLFGIAHPFIEVNFGGGDEGSDAAGGAPQFLRVRARLERGARS